MVSLLGLGLVLAYNVAGVHPDVAKFDKNMSVSDKLANLPTQWWVGIIVVVVCVLLTLWAVWRSKHETAEMREIVGSLDDVG